MKRHKKGLAVWLTAVLLLLIAALLAGSPGRSESVQEAMRDAVLHDVNQVSLFGLRPVAPGMISAFLVTAVLLLAAAAVRIFAIPRFRYIPGKLQLVLEELAYPSSGRTGKIDYSGNAMTRSEALVLLLGQMREALAPYGTRLSLLVSEKLLLSGSDEATGEDLTALLPMVDAVYVDTADPAAAKARLTELAGENAPALVVMGADGIRTALNS